MNKQRLTIIKSALIALLVLSFNVSFGQIIFTGNPDSIAVLNEVYSYDVNVTASPNDPVFSLTTSPVGMSINSSTGVITWTPTNMNQGGKVVVHVTNSYPASLDITYYIYITDEVICDANIMAYWPMDVKTGSGSHMLPDVVNAHDANWSGPTQPEPTISADAMVGNSVLFAPGNADDEFYNVADDDIFDPCCDEDFSVSFWFKNQTPGYGPVVDEKIVGRYNNNPGANWYIQWSPSTEKLSFFMMDGGTDDTVVVNNTIISDNNWHHVVATVNIVSGEEYCYLHLFVDKTMAVQAFDFFTGNFSGTNPFNIGWYAEGGRAYSGYLDELTYWNKELLSADVTSLYNKGVAHQPMCSEGNLAPIIVSTAVTAATEDVAYSYTLVYRELDGDVVTKSAPTLPSWLSFNTTTGVLSGTPTNSNVGSHNVTLRVTEGSINVDQSFTINVANVNDAPVISSTATTSVNEDAAYSYTIVASDVDAGATLTYSAPTLPSWMSFNTSTHILSGTPTNDQVGTNAYQDYPVVLRVTDNLSAIDEESFTLRVNQVNDAPQITAQAAISTNEDVDINIEFTDLTVTDVDNVYPDDFDLIIGDGSNYTHTGNTVEPAANWYGTLTVPVTLSDGNATDEYDVTITVNSVNDVPYYTSTAVETALVGTLYQYWISTSDDDADATLTLTCPTKPDWLSFSVNQNTAILQGVPAAGDVGEDNVVVNVTDGTASVDQSFTITVGANALNDNSADIAKVYPIPASDYVIFEFANLPSNINVKIYSLSGDLILEENFSSQQTINMNISDLNPNQYIYKINTDEGYQRGMILVK